MASDSLYKVNLDEVAIDLGIGVIREPMEREIKGMCVTGAKGKDGNYIRHIILNSTIPDVESRFYLAMCLSLIRSKPSTIVVRGIVEFSTFTKLGILRKEVIEALNMCIPGDKLSYFFTEELGEDFSNTYLTEPVINKMARKFGVSPVIATLRLMV